MESARYDTFADGYAEFVGSSVVHAVAFSALLPLCAPAGAVLDLGCGEGVLARELAAAGNAVTGVDVSVRLIELARAREEENPLGITYIVDDASILGEFSGAVFDGVATSLTFTDFDDLEAVCRSVGRVLVPGGWFAFAALHPCFEPPHASSVEVDGRVARQVNGYFDEGPWRSRNPDSLIGIRHHRRISTILNSVIDAGLVITRVAEPRGDELARARSPIYGEVAEVFVGRAEKPTAWCDSRGPTVHRVRD